MKPEEILDLVRKMRAAQRRYFRDRTPKNLIASKDLEKQVDDALDPQRSLL